MGLGVGHRVGLSMCLGVGELGLGVGHSVGLGVGLGVELGLSVQPWPTTAVHLPMHRNQPLLVGLGGHGGRWPGRLVGVGLGVGPGRLGVGLGVRRNVSLSLYRHLSRRRSKGVR